MAEYLINGDTLTQLANTMRSVSDGVPNPCTLEQMNECIPNLNKKLTDAPEIAFQNGVFVVTPTTDASNIAGYEIYKTAWSSNQAPSFIDSKPCSKIKLKNGIAYITGAEDHATFKIKAYSEKGYQSADMNSKDFILYVASDSGYNSDLYDLSVKVYLNQHDPGYFQIGELNVSNGDHKSTDIVFGNKIYGSIVATLDDPYGTVGSTNVYYEYSVSLVEFGEYKIEVNGRALEIEVKRPASLG